MRNMRNLKNTFKVVCGVFVVICVILMIFSIGQTWMDYIMILSKKPELSEGLIGNSLEAQKARALLEELELYFGYLKDSVVALLGIPSFLIICFQLKKAIYENPKRRAELELKKLELEARKIELETRKLEKDVRKENVLPEGTEPDKE